MAKQPDRKDNENKGLVLEIFRDTINGNPTGAYSPFIHYEDGEPIVDFFADGKANPDKDKITKYIPRIRKIIEDDPTLLRIKLELTYS